MSIDLGDPPQADNPEAPAAGTEQPQQPQEVVVPRFEVGEDGTLGENWFNSNLVEEQYRGDKTLANIKTIQGMTSTLVNQRKMIGADPESVLIKPGKNATEEQRAEFYRKLGVPENMEGYEESLKDIQLPEGVTLDEAQKGEFLKFAKEKNLMPDQVRSLMEWDAARQAAMGTASEEAQAQAMEQLKDKVEEDLRKDEHFGGKSYDESYAKAIAAFRQYTTQFGIEKGTPRYQALKDTLESNADAMRILSDVGGNYTEARFVQGEREHMRNNSPEGIAQRQQEVISQLSTMKPGDPQFARLNAELEQLSRSKVAINEARRSG